VGVQGEASGDDADAVAMAGALTTLPGERGRALPCGAAVGGAVEHGRQAAAFDRPVARALYQHPNFESYSQALRRLTGATSVHFALALRAEESCVRCHSEQIIAAGLINAATTQATTAPTSSATSQPATAPVIAPDTLIGLVTLR